jgi:hypothetical protein
MMAISWLFLSLYGVCVTTLRNWLDGGTFKPTIASKEVVLGNGVCHSLCKEVVLEYSNNPCAP